MSEQSLVELQDLLREARSCADWLSGERLDYSSDVVTRLADAFERFLRDTALKTP